MNTGDLLKALAADTARTGMPLRTAWRMAAALAIVLAAAGFFALLGPRADFSDALGTMRFPFKFVVTLAVVVSAFALLRSLSSPESEGRRYLPWLLLAPALLCVAVVLELLMMPASLWEARLVGTNDMKCLTFIPLIAIAPLAVFLATLRYGASTRPILSGGAAGLLAGGLAATFYAAHCPDDSPLFVATWYTIAIVGTAIVGALLAPRVARW